MATSTSVALINIYRIYTIIILLPTHTNFIQVLSLTHKSNTTGATSGAENLALVFIGVSCYSIFKYFVDHCLSLCDLSFGHCIVCP